MNIAMDSPLAYPESPLETDEQVFPCKGCNQILEEGKAFELAGNRWHIDCFRCNTCGTLLDSDANLLLLGDGSLICNNCTYSCSNCNNKIEDLAILTGDQAFCADCFKCRNCKKKIENLRYARTSQGIFCMDCHEALMARRRKRPGRSSGQRSNPSKNLDKSLPAIPPPDARMTAYIASTGTPPPPPPLLPVTYTPPPPAEAASTSRPINELQRDVDSDSSSRPSTGAQNQQRPDALTLPSTTFKNPRQSYMSQRSDISGGEEFLIPLTFDPTPPMNASPSMVGPGSVRAADEKNKDYFTTRAGNTQTAPQLQTLPSTKLASPHIAYQEKRRQSSQEGDLMRKQREGSSSRAASAAASPFIIPQQAVPPQEEIVEHTIMFQKDDDDRDHTSLLQNAPMTQPPAVPSPASLSEPTIVGLVIPAEIQPETMPEESPIERAQEMRNGRDLPSPRLSYESSPASAFIDSPNLPQHQQTSLLSQPPKRGDSLDTAKRTQNHIPRKELNASAKVAPVVAESLSGSTPPISTSNQPDPIHASSAKVLSGPFSFQESKPILDTPHLPTSEPGTGKSMISAFQDPRAPPAPPSNHSRSRNQSTNTLFSEQQRIMESQRSPTLLRYSGGGDFSLDEDMARILGTEEQQAQDSFLRRVSNSVRHGRSYSDKSSRLSKDRWPRSPIVASIGQEISSPSTASPENRDELSWFKNELRRERQKNIEREKKIAELEAQIASAGNIKQVTSELKEKRSTIVVLDAQKEIVVRELEILTEHISKAKQSREPLDIAKMSSAALREFAESLENLKQSFGPQIEDSIEKRNALVDEIANLIQMKDKNFLEFEQLSSKNAQLAELNNQLVHQIQELYKANSGPVAEPVKNSMNGLGIYAQPKEKTAMPLQQKDNQSIVSEPLTIESMATLQGKAEPVAVIQGPQVVNIRKEPPKKFDWRKGQKVAKGMTKGLKGAFSSTQQSYSREMQFAETGAYGAAPQGQEYQLLPKPGQEPPRQGFGFFGNQKSTGKMNGIYTTQSNASTPSLLLDASIHLFGSDLEQRAEYEKSTIPTIVRHCVEEVESRGMDVEGIYRKSGGNSQVQQVREAFERSQADLDLSDPELDIHSVTSALKQYFRKLPMPLITFDVYDRLLDSASIPDREARIEAMQRAVEFLPRVHYETLEYLIRHLARVVEQEKVNLMTSMNVAVVFAPTIMRPESLGRELSDTKMKNDAIMWMVEESERIFRN